MISKSLNKPSEEVIKEIRQVELICKEHDKLVGRSLDLDQSANFDSEINGLFLLYEDEKLVSLISMFIPSRREAELSAYTLPEYRQKGYFKRLFSEAVKEIQKFEIPSLLLVCEPQSRDARKVIDKLNAKLEFTEYLLRYKGPSGNHLLKEASEVELRKAEQHDLDAMAGLRQDIFSEDYEDAKSYMAKCFEADNRAQYLAWLSGRPIGMGSVCLEDGEAYLYGFGVKPNYQGKGFGKEILTLLINEVKRNGMENMAIEVDSSNQKAFNLYRKCGFEVEASFDYFRKTVSEQ